MEEKTGEFMYNFGVEEGYNNQNSMNEKKDECS